MTRIMACRICLAYDVRLFSISNGPLQNIYEKFTDMLLEAEDMRPACVCYICFSLLKKFQRLIDKAKMANQVLLQLIASGLEMSIESLSMFRKQHTDLSWMLSVSPIETTTFLDPIAIKLETQEENIKAEFVKPEMDRDDVVDQNDEDDFDTIPLETTNQDSSTDSEDNLPLHNISKLWKDNIKKKPRVKIKRKDRMPKRTKMLKPDAQEIILTKEEQIQHMLERSKSLNYQNSPFKCELCFKGFVDSRAFENHKEKHDERSGRFECGICRMRYRTARHLRTHAATSHQRQFACNKCPHRSHTTNQAREHERWHSGFTYECQLCSQKFRKPTSYLTHMRKRHPTEHICNICGDSFVGKHGLLMHKSKAHKRDQTENEDATSHKYCADCKIQFVSYEAFSKHVLTSIKHRLASESGTSCLICDIEVPQGTLKAHLQNHENAMKTNKNLRKKLTIAQLPCEQCGINFVNRSKLQAHIKRIHLGLKYNKNIVCEVCGKKCTSNASLKYHQRTHTGEKPFSCTVCPKRFADNNQLRIHSRSHTGERPYCCAACGKRFSQKPALNRHYRVHTGAKPYDCQYCAKTFSQSNSLKLHVNTVHLKLPPNKKKSTNTNVEEQSAATQTDPSCVALVAVRRVLPL